jgi:hypothetical protein
MGERHEVGSPRIERGLEAVLGTPDPEAAFIAELEQQLVARAQARQRPQGESRPRRFWARWKQLIRQHRWAAAAGTLMLVAAVALAVVGPQRIVAAVQQLLGYVPGIGFVDLEATRLLAAPVEVSRNGVILQVEQVIAQPDGTKVIIRSEGLPPEDQLWPDGAREDGNYRPLLRLPDGRTLATGTWSLRLGAGTLEFPPLPDGIHHITLELPRLPLLPPGAAPENWMVPLDLRPATGELVAELFPQPYAPPDTEDTHRGIILRVLGVAHSAEETAVRLQVQWPNPDWMFPHVGYFRLPHLRDDLGHIYHEVPASSTGSTVQTEVIRIHEGAGVTPTPASEISTHELVRTFAPVSPSARKLTLWVDAVGFEVPADASFTVDLGDDPQLGDHWPLDVHLTVAGFPVHISGARLVQEQVHLRDGVEQQTALHFDFDPVPERNGRTLHDVRLLSTSALGSRGGYDPQTHTIRASLDLGTWPWVPSGPIEVRVEGARILFHGPWTVTWTVTGGEGKEEAQAAGQVGPAILRLDGARDTHAGLTLQANQVVRTDRVTAVTVELGSASPGVTLNRVLSRNPAEEENGLYLEDNRSRRYERSDGITWQPDPEEASALLALGARPPFDVSPSLSFQSLDPLARRATLHVPALELFVADRIAFDVTVPDGVELRLDTEPPWPASEPWQVDIPLEVAGYRLHINQAQLHEMNDTTSLMLISDPPESRPIGPWLTGLRPTSVVAPDGRALDLAYAFRFDETGMAFDLADPETGTVQPGRYHFELDGITVAVPGPWELSWDLVEP